MYTYKCKRSQDHESQVERVRVTDLRSFEVHKDVMVIVDGMRKRRGEFTSSLEVFPTDKTSVNVDVGKGD
jgi:hypothetical protein